MPHPRRSRKRQQPYVPLDGARLHQGVKRTEVRAGAEWYVQPVAVHQAVKEYRCPGCHSAIAVGVAHVVAWRADSIFGDAAIDDRRHWHRGCWRVA